MTRGAGRERLGREFATFWQGRRRFSPEFAT
jgi:hypothetical protein